MLAYDDQWTALDTGGDAFTMGPGDVFYPPEALPVTACCGVESGPFVPAPSTPLPPSPVPAPVYPVTPGGAVGIVTNGHAPVPMDAPSTLVPGVPTWMLAGAAVVALVWLTRKR